MGTTRYRVLGPNTLERRVWPLRLRPHARSFEDSLHEGGRELHAGQQREVEILMEEGARAGVF